MGSALSIKLTVLVLLPLRLLAARERRRIAIGFAAVATAIAVVASIAYGSGWLRVLSPVANRLPSLNVWCSLFASKRHTPARVSSSGHGSLPGDFAVRSFSWHVFDGDPMST